MILTILNLSGFPFTIFLAKLLKKRGLIKEEKIFYLVAGFNLGIGLMSISKYL